ncbi:hypothetical protein RRF57_005811 [Xylaria bambusicola]|uniref:Glucose-methanol-choline oxidoreductase N-terminal domain-containing protein n=1 Tax=Xylaria bambusicola TaxID=326684 RepID=A0AAN7Z9H0_9PEZI
MGCGIDSLSGPPFWLRWEVYKRSIIGQVRITLATCDIARGRTINMAIDQFEFITIGSGATGLVLDNHLIEDNKAQELVLEAGEDITADPRVTTPALFSTLIGSDADWDPVTEAQSILGNRKITMPHCRIPGGGSAING